MENYFQKIIAYLLSILLFFVFPIYVSYEKRDDLSHAMASKATHIFVDTVRNKGYVAPKMYQDYSKLLTLTGNTYNIEMEHTKKRYDPVVYIYGVKDGKVVIVDEMTDEYYRDNVKGTDTFNYRGKQYDKFLNLNNGKYVKNEVPGTTIETLKRTSKVSTEVFSDQMMLNKIFPKYMYNIMGQENSTLEVPSMESDVRKYLLSVGDNFTVNIRNKNTTLATVLFYTITSQRQQYGVPKIYISYGGVVRNELIKEVITSNVGTPNEGEEFPDLDDTIISNSTDEPAKVSSLEIGEHKEFNLKGDPEIFELTRGTYRIEVWGAQGGGVKNSTISGGRGGYVEGVIEITEISKLLDIRVGGKGGDAGSGNSGAISKLNTNGGYNGGGNGSGVGGAGGGGSSEVRLGGEGPENRILVAAGGGGNTLSAEFATNTDGGLQHTNLTINSEGEDGCIESHVLPYANDECGGGGGLFGGKTVHGDDPKYAFGGTNYVNMSYITNHSMTPGIQTGNGKVVITRLR